MVGASCRRLGLRPDLEGAETAAVLQEAGILVGEPHLLASTEFPVTARLNAGEVREAVPRRFRCDDHAPALIGIEPLNHASDAVLRRTRFLVTGRFCTIPAGIAGRFAVDMACSARGAAVGGRGTSLGQSGSVAAEAGSMQRSRQMVFVSGAPGQARPAWLCHWPLN
jgi:hypothetical protein